MDKGKFFDEVTGITRTEGPDDGAFSHMVVDKPVENPLKLGKVTYGGAAYMIGTKRECQEWQLRNGQRAKTEVIPF